MSQSSGYAIVDDRILILWRVHLLKKNSAESTIVYAEEGMDTLTHTILPVVVPGFMSSHPTHTHDWVALCFIHSPTPLHKEVTQHYDGKECKHRRRSHLNRRMQKGKCHY